MIDGMDAGVRSGLVLLMDTAGTPGSVALARVGKEEAVVVAEAELPGRSASERLLGAGGEMLAGAGARLKDLRAIGVVNGPGSFTGIRVGVSAAKGLSEALGIGVVAVSRLAVLAGKGSGEVLTLLDAGRGEVYCGQYLAEECVGEWLLRPEQVMELVRLHAGVEVVACEERVAGLMTGIAVKVVAEPRAADAVWLVQQGEFEDVAALDANYVRRSDAELFVKQRIAG
jgi:tRNA threonylcarbamoyladenosine biosynthesis protein TsaB